jgi:hypothetical protein
VVLACDEATTPAPSSATIRREHGVVELNAGRGGELDLWKQHEVEVVGNECYESLDSLQLASNTLIPPFKSVRMQNEPLLEGFAISHANKTYTQSQTIVVTKELTVG